MQLLAQETFVMQMCKGIVWTNMIQFKGPAKQQIKLRNLRHCFKNKWSKISQNRVKFQYKILEFSNMINYIWVMHKCMFLHSLQFLENAPPRTAFSFLILIPKLLLTNFSRCGQLLLEHLGNKSRTNAFLNLLTAQKYCRNRTTCSFFINSIAWNKRQEYKHVIQKMKYFHFNDLNLGPVFKCQTFDT